MGKENQKVKSTLQRMAQVQKDLDTAEAAALAAEEISVVAEAPTAVATDRGKIIILDGGTGVADIVKVCVKGTDDEYSYVTVTVS